MIAMVYKEKILAEIERLMDLFPKPHGKVLPIDQNAYNLIGDLKRFVESLSTEQPNFKVEFAGKEYEVVRVRELYNGTTMYGILDEPNHIDYINKDSCKIVSEHPSEDLEYLATSLEETIGTSPHSRETIISYLQQAAQWQKEQIINKACEWLRYCVDVNDEVKMIDGEPEAESLVQKNLHRIEVTNQIVEDFKKAMEDG